MKITLADILSVAPNGKAQLHVDGYPATFVLPSHVRDHIAMGRFQQWLVGAMPPAMTWRHGIAISAKLLRLQSVREILELILHENVHWWQLWRRMGPTDFPATYGWQGIVSRIRVGSAHLHDDHLVEREARRVARRILEEVDYMLLQHQPVTFDVEAWLQQHYPASRP